MRHNNEGGAGSGCHGPTRAGETPEPAKQRAFAGLRRGLLFENRMQKMRNPACASFFAVANQAHSVPQFTFDSSDLSPPSVAGLIFVLFYRWFLGRTTMVRIQEILCGR